MKPTLPMLLTFTGGYVDTAGFLALQGLFTAHVTGNFVTLGASLVLGTSGALAKLLALPVFCAVVILVRWSGDMLRHRRLPVMRTLLGVQVLLLAIGAALAIGFGPFRNGDAWPAVLTGMVFVAAMAIQNAFHRVHLPGTPPGTLMTGTTTQAMIELADLLLGGTPDRPTRGQVLRTVRPVVLFAAGCALAALAFAIIGEGCFVLPPVIILGGAWMAPPASQPMR